MFLISNYDTPDVITVVFLISTSFRNEQHLPPQQGLKLMQKWNQVKQELPGQSQSHLQLQEGLWSLEKAEAGHPRLKWL